MDGVYFLEYYFSLSVGFIYYSIHFFLKCVYIPGLIMKKINGHSLLARTVV